LPKRCPPPGKAAGGRIFALLGEKFDYGPLKPVRRELAQCKELSHLAHEFLIAGDILQNDLLSVRAMVRDTVGEPMGLREGSGCVNTRMAAACKRHRMDRFLSCVLERRMRWHLAQYVSYRIMEKKERHNILQKLT
jgi:hypothetical protein